MAESGETSRCGMRRNAAVVVAAAVLVTLALVYTHQDGGASILDENGSNVFGGSRLQNKNSDALNLLSKVFGGGTKAHSAHEAHKLAVAAKMSPAKKSALKKLSAKGNLANPKYSEHRGRKAPPGIPPIPPPPHILGALPGQGGPMSAEPPPNPVQEGLQEIMGGWTGAGWWQPCSEVCTAGRSRAEMKKVETFKQFQACEANCRKTKAGQLKKVIAHVKEVVAEEGGPTGGPGGPGGGPGMQPPHMVAQRVSKHLLKWAETQGLPKKLADNPKDMAQVGQSVTGMLIAGWSQAGWWKPCGEVCRGSKHFKEFMACEQKCQTVKSQLIENTMDPKTFGPPQNAKASAKKAGSKKEAPKK